MNLNFMWFYFILFYSGANSDAGDLTLTKINPPKLNTVNKIKLETVVFHLEYLLLLLALAISK